MKTEANVALLLTGSYEHGYSLYVTIGVEKPFRVEDSGQIICQCDSKSQAMTLLSLLRSLDAVVEVEKSIRRELEEPGQ
jgi:hypothetical protein